MDYRLRALDAGRELASREEVLVKGREIVCPELSTGRVVLERVNLQEGLVVLRVARRPAKPKAVPAHFLVLALVGDAEGEVLVSSDPVMTLPAAKSGFERDVPTFVPFEE